MRGVVVACGEGSVGGSVGGVCGRGLGGVCGRFHVPPGWLLAPRDTSPTHTPTLKSFCGAML